MMKFQRDTTKTQFSGKPIFVISTEKYQREISEVERIKSGKVIDKEKDSALIAVLKSIPNSIKSVSFFLNYVSVLRILDKHGDFAVDDLILTANEFDVGVYIKSEGVMPDKVNLVKKIPKGGILVLGANRFNGYGIVTFFAQYNPRQAQQYLASIKKRGMLFGI